MKTKLLILSLISIFALAQIKQVQPITTKSNSYIPKIKHFAKQENDYLKHLQETAVYDQEMECYFVFETLPTDLEKTAIAQQNNIYFAKPNVLNLYITNKSAVEKLQAQGINCKKVAVDVYQVAVTGDMAKAKETFQKKQGVIYVVYEYYAYPDNCVTWNDPQATNTWGGGYGQAHLSNIDWISIAPTYPNTPTHAIDSVDTWRQMHTISTIANPNVVCTVIDGGVDVNNTDFAGNVLYAYDFSNNVTGNTLTNSNHGSRVSALIIAKANNSYGSVGVAHDFPIMSFDTGTDAGLISSASYSTLDYSYNQALNNPSQKQIVNMSFSSGNDPIFLQKLQQSYNLQNNSQVFFVASSGNSGAPTLAYPAGWSEVFGVGAVNAEDPNKALWSGSNTGSTLDFIADGQSVRVMEANGTFSNKNGTSYSAPIVAGAIANLVAQDPTANFQTIYNRLKGGAKDYGTAGFDNSYGWGYARTASSLKYAVVEDVPLSIDCGGNSSYTYSFTPKFYNHATKTVNRKCYYPNGTQVPFVTNGDGTVTFNVIINTSKGFSATNPAINRLRYEFVPLGYASCLTSIKSKPITISNFGTLSNQQFNEVFLNFYPNPVKNNLYISDSENLQFDNNILIYDVQGRLINQQKATKTADNLVIDMQNLTSGLYFVQIKSNNEFIKPKTIKVIKE
jgi:hypothetical protein